MLNQCDYKPIYSQNNQNFGIKIIEFNENRSNKILATRLKNYSYKKNNLFSYELKLLTSENKLILSKDTKGDPLLLGLKINLKIEIYENEKLITKKTKAIVFVNYGGILNNLEKLNKIAKKNKIILIQDAAQSLGARYKKKSITKYADFTIFSFQAIKHITSGDGGALTVRNKFHEKKGKRIR